MARVWLVAATALLAGCTAAQPEPSSLAGSSPLPGSCNADLAQAGLGQSPSADLGAKLMRQAGARTLRWIAPGMAVTMDFRPDRLSVSYDAQRTITQITCG